jgi:hypothetical protein
MQLHTMDHPDMLPRDDRFKLDSVFTPELDLSRVPIHQSLLNECLHSTPMYASIFFESLRCSTIGKYRIKDGFMEFVEKQEKPFKLAPHFKPVCVVLTLRKILVNGDHQDSHYAWKIIGSDTSSTACKNSFNY